MQLEVERKCDNAHNQSPTGPQHQPRGGGAMAPGNSVQQGIYRLVPVVQAAPASSHTKIV